MTKTKDLNERYQKVKKNDKKAKEISMKQIKLILTIFPGVLLHHLI